MNQQLQQLQADLNKKDYELQRQDSKSSWEHEQQQEMCDKLRAALQEKDKTIEVSGTASPLELSPPLGISWNHEYCLSVIF